MENKNRENNKVIIYKAEDGQTRIEVKLENETVWLSQKQMAEIFGCSDDNVSLHLKNIFKEGELDESSVTEEFSTTVSDGKTYKIKHYNLDAIISVGYRINSIRGTQFRIWATQQLKEYIVKGFVMDDERLKNGGTMRSYFEELLERVRKIRTSERNLYEKVKDIFATSIDYDSKTDYTRQFYAIMQNKFHYAITGQTAAELVANRIDSQKENLGLTNFGNKTVTRKEAEVAKNYMLETELRQLYLLVEQFLSFAEFQIERKNQMYMGDWVGYLHEMLKANKLDILSSKGNVSHKVMEEKVKQELQRFLNQKHLE